EGGGDVFALVFGGSAASDDLGERTLFGKQGLEELGRTHQVDAFIGEHLGNGAQKHICTAGAEVEKKLGEAPVRSDATEDLLVLDLACHHGGFHIFLVEDFNEAR